MRSEPSAAAATQARMVEALVAGEGFRRVAAIAEELVGAPVEILLPRPGSEGLEGTAAERYVAALVAGERPEQPDEVGAMVPIEAGGELHGAVVMLGKGIEDSEEHLRAAAIASLTGVAMLNAREEASRSGGDLLVADILAGVETRAGEILRRARLAGCDLAADYFAACVNPGASGGRLLKTIRSIWPKALAEASDDRIYALVPGSAEDARRLTCGLGHEVTSAFSSVYRKASDARHALEEAELLLAMAESGGRRDTSPATWDSIRVLYRGFVADPVEIADFAERNVGAVARYDEEHGAELQATFWAFQESNCNLNVTARATYTHRHTVSNRLAKIEELTGLDPQRSYDRELLSMAFKAHSVVAATRRR